MIGVERLQGIIHGYARHTQHAWDARQTVLQVQLRLSCTWQLDIAP